VKANAKFHNFFFIQYIGKLNEKKIFKEGGVAILDGFKALEWACQKVVWHIDRNLED